MILHPDGRVEGTPEEVAAYKREMHPKIMLADPKYEREVQYTAAKLAEINRQQISVTNAKAQTVGIRDDVSSTSVDRTDGPHALRYEMDKPPLGIVPRHVHDTIRLNALKEAIQRRKEAGIAAFPYEWQLEADELRSALDAYYGKEAPHWLKPCDSEPFKLESAETTKELTEEQVSSLSTYRLSQELATREGVHAKRLGPDARISIIISDGENSSEKTFDGPAVILVNQD